MVKLNEVLEFLENNLNVEHIQKVKCNLKSVLNYERVEGVPLKIGFESRTFTRYPYLQTFEDMEKMMVNQLLVPCGAAQIKDHTLPMIRANYGVGTLPSLFGLNCRIVNNNLPWVDHVGTLEEIKRIIEHGIPDMRAGLGARVFDTHNYYNEQLAKYPKCQALIPVYHPDLQGPFDIAHLIWGSDIYYALYDEPDVVHELMELVTLTYIQFMKEIKKTINDEENGFNFHWGTLYKGSILIRDDSPVNISKEMYEEFVKPYDQKILDAFGPGSIHFCGRADQWVFSMMECRGLEALNFGQPPKLKFGFDFLEKIYGKAKEKKIALVDYNMDKALLPEILESEYTSGVTFSTSAENLEEAIKLVNQFCKV